MRTDREEAAPTRGYVVQLGLLALATAAGVFARTALSPVQEAMRASLELSDNQMALLQGPAMALPVLICATPIGLMIDRHARGRLILAFAVCLLAGSVLTALTSSFAGLFMARCLVGLAGPAIWMAAMSLLGDLYAPTQRGRANMVIVVGQCLGNSAAFALGGFALALLSEFGPEAWRYTLLALSIPLIAVAGLTLALREPPRSERRVMNPSVREAYAELWRYRSIAGPLVIGLSLIGIADGAAVIWVAPVFSRSFALAPDRIGAIMGMVLLTSGVLGPIVGGMLADISQKSGGVRRTLWSLTGLALLCVPASLFAVTGSVTSASTAFFVFMTLGTAIIVAGTTLFTVVVPNEVRGLCMAILSAAFLLFGFGIAPVVVSMISGAMGGSAAIAPALAWVCTIASILATSAFAAGIRSCSGRSHSHLTPSQMGESRLEPSVDWRKA